MVARLLTRVEPPGTMVRVGRNPKPTSNDGEYVVPLEELASVDAVLSYGVGKTVCFEQGLLKFIRPDANIFFFDHTVATLPAKHPRFRFKKQGVGPKPGRDLDTLENHAKAISAAKRPMLCMDVEGAEWESLAATGSETLRLFCLVVIEVHLHWLGASEGLMRSVLERLDADFVLLHVHANNNSAPVPLPGGKEGERIPAVLELTYMRRDIYRDAGGSFRPVLGPLPTSLDRPNRETKADYVLSCDGGYPVLPAHCT